MKLTTTLALLIALLATARADDGPKNVQIDGNGILCAKYAPAKKNSVEKSTKGMTTFFSFA